MNFLSMPTGKLKSNAGGEAYSVGIGSTKCQTEYHFYLIVGPSDDLHGVQLCATPRAKLKMGRQAQHNNKENKQSVRYTEIIE